MSLSMRIQCTMLMYIIMYGCIVFVGVVSHVKGGSSTAGHLIKGMVSSAILLFPHFTCNRSCPCVDGFLSSKSDLDTHAVRYLGPGKGQPRV